MTNNPRDNKTFEAKVGNLIAATRHLAIPQILLLRRLTMADPESRRWATERQLQVVFSVIVAKAVERVGLDVLRDARARNFEPLLPPASDAERLDDLAVLTEVAAQMLGPGGGHEHDDALAKLLSMAPAAAGAGQTRTRRQAAPIKEPPPLFAAQLGPDAMRMLASDPTRAMGEDDGKPFTDFPTLFDDTLCGYTRKILGLLQVRGSDKSGRMPFILSPDFALCYEEVLRRFVLPPMKASRHLQQLGMNYNWAEVGGAKLIDIIQGGEVNNPVLHNWDTRWHAFRTVKGKKPKDDDNPWPMIREDATRGNYEPPGEEHMQILQDILRWEGEGIAKAWRELTQLYEQEFSPNGRQEQAREGAFRDGVMKWTSKLPDHVGEFLALKAYYMFPRVDGNFLYRLQANFGRSDSDRRRAAPFLVDFVQNLNV